MFKSYLGKNVTMNPEYEGDGSIENTASDITGIFDNH